MSKALRLDRFAELGARMAAGEPRAVVLAAESVDETTWQRSQEFWFARMAEEVQKSRFVLAQRYASLYVAAQGRLAKSKPPRAVARPNHGARANVVPALPAPSSVTPGTESPRGNFSSHAPPYRARLTLQQWAAVRAEIATQPDSEHEAIKGRFGLDGTTWPEEERHWQRQLATEAALFAQYVRHFQYCKSLLQREL
jgi:hypothetical protein